MPNSSFLAHAAQRILTDHSDDLHNVLILLPNKRGELFLKKALGSLSDKPILSPRMYTVEQFVQSASGLQTQSQLQLIMRLYDVYKREINAEEPLNTFLKWASTLLQDVNEIDRHMVDPGQLFGNLLDAKTIEHWGAELGQETALMQSYLAFWKSLHPLYNAFRNTLLEAKLSYQGLAYRQVAEDGSLLNSFIGNRFSGIYLLGFNALNAAEEQIFQHLIANHNATPLWDGDAFYVDDPDHEAGSFLRKYRTNWPTLQQNGMPWIGNHISTVGKNVHILSALNGQGMAKAAGQIVSKLQLEDEQETAMVLADEALLLPVLDYIPDTVEEINVTMGYPLRHAPIAQDVMQIFKLHEQAERSAENGSYSFHHKRFMAVLESRFFRRFHNEAANAIIQKLHAQNHSFISSKSAQGLLTSYLPIENPWINLFESSISHEVMVAEIGNLLTQFAQQMDSKNAIEQQSIFALHQVLNQLAALLKLAGDERLDMRTLVTLFKSTLTDHQIDFYGEPLAGLQVMGMLETRTLDFKRVIITSLNEGILPAGKMQNSFIPFDLKMHFGLPTHNEKDAIYAYHFYRLLQRAEEVYLIYNSDTQSFGAKERSRFIAQIQHEWRGLANVNIADEKQLIPVVKKESLRGLPQFTKDEDVLNRLEEMARKGLSPSALITFVNDPAKFFEERVLRVDEPDEIEETIGYDVLGTVVHDALEELYKPLIGSPLKESQLAELVPRVEAIVQQKLAEHYRGNIDTGRNLLIKNVAIHMVKKELEVDRQRVLHLNNQNRQLVVTALEHNMEIVLDVPGIDFPVTFRGIADRIDRIGSDIYVLDYKTGAMKKSELGISAIGQTVEPDKKPKAFQVLFYAWIYEKNFGMPDGELSAGIFATRSPGEGFMELAVNKSNRLTPEILQSFEEELFTVVRDLFDTTKAFEPRFITLENTV